jgi:hypothetical protein
LSSPRARQAVQQLAQEPLLGASLEQPRTELAQHRVVEARIVQLEAEQVLPVDARPHRFRGLAVGQVLAELQDGDERQAPGRQARLAEPGEQVGEVRVGEDAAELVAELQQRVALAEGGPGDARRRLGHGLDRDGLERHGRPPAGWTRRSIPVRRASADFANGIKVDTVGEVARLSGRRAARSAGLG